MDFKTENIACAFCNGEDNKPFDKSQGWTIVECTKCGFKFTNPRPTAEELPKFYDRDYYLDEEIFGESYQEDGGAESDFIYPKRITELENWFSERGKVLELGAARGGYVNALAKRGWKAQGIDISEYAVGFGRKRYGVDLIAGTLESVDFQDTFDAIVMYQVLEHVPSPKKILEESYGLLNENGIIVIEVPNLESFDMKINKKRKMYSYDLPRHLSHFSPGFLQSELEKLGFSILDIDLFHPKAVLKAAGYFARMKTGNKTPAEVQEPAKNSSESVAKDLPMQKKAENWKHKLINSVSTIMPGWRFTIVARKGGN